VIGDSHRVRNVLAVPTGKEAKMQRLNREQIRQLEEAYDVCLEIRDADENWEDDKGQDQTTRAQADAAYEALFSLCESLNPEDEDEDDDDED
jgi:hypothetical protein